MSDKVYEMCHVDFDTVLFRAAKSLQKDFIIVEHKATGWKKRFDGVSKFYGLGKAKNKGWIGEQNAEREASGKPLISVDDFIIHTDAEVIDCPDPNMSILEYGLQQIDFKVGDIKKAANATDYRLWIGSLAKNFRYDIAKITPYKGERKAKPILFLELREAFLDKYKSKVCVSKDGLEVDDEISILGWESYKHFLKTGKHKYVLGYVDKDLKMTPCPFFNYDKVEDGITIPEPYDCALAYAAQLLSGDKSTDNIVGLPNISKEFADKYKLGKPKGVGKATALQILEGCATPVEMYSRVCEAYKSFYGGSEFDFTDYEGNVSKRNWKDMLRENASLLYMCRTEDEAGTYDVIKSFEKLGVEIEQS